jgi:transcriptional regulator with XRE-family HTH domain
MNRFGFPTRLPVVTYGRMKFSAKLKKLRTDRGWSQEAVAEKVDVSQNLVSLWERTSLPDLYEAKKLAEIFGVDLTYLTTDEMDEPPASRELPDDERLILITFRALGLDIEEAIRRLNGHVAMIGRQDRPQTPPERAKDSG